MSAPESLGWIRSLKVLWRYNVDLIRMNRAASRALTSFDVIYDVLDSDRPESFVASPEELWDLVGLIGPASVSFDELLDRLGVCRDGVQWWRYYLPYQGCIRDELLAAANLNNYNQDNGGMNGTFLF